MRLFTSHQTLDDNLITGIKFEKNKVLQMRSYFMEPLVLVFFFFFQIIVLHHRLNHFEVFKESKTEADFMLPKTK